LGCATLTAKAGSLGNPVLPNFTSCNKQAIATGSLVQSRSPVPYYNERNKTNIFYAVLGAGHYLMLTGKTERAVVEQIYSFVENGADPVEAANRAFGDLAQLQKALQSYITKTSYLDTSFHSRADKMQKIIPFARFLLPKRKQDWETSTSIVANWIQLKKSSKGHRLDPNLPAAQESMGLLLFRQDKRYEAERFFSRAVALDSKSALAYYYHATLLMSQGADAEEMAEAKTTLEKSRRTQPGTRLGVVDLGLLYANDAGALDKALSAEKRRVNTVPGELTSSTTSP